MQVNIRKLLGGLSKCALLLLLSVLVIGWGLGAKLDLYHAAKHQLPTTDSTAKLSVETRSSPAFLSAPQQTKPNLIRRSVTFDSLSFPLPQSHFSASEMRQRGARRVVAQRRTIYGPRSMRGPPLASC